MLDRRTLLAAGLGTVLGRGALAGPLTALDPPAGTIILTVTGDLKTGNGNGVARFDRPLLEALGYAELETATPWTDGVSRFGGVLASRLLDALGSRAVRIDALALNDYTVSIPVSDLDAYGVLLATSRDGRPLEVRERGPVWVIYPWSEHPELDTRVYHQRSIWQLSELRLVA